MYILNNSITRPGRNPAKSSWQNLQELKDIQNHIDHRQIEVGGYYLYKEKFGMVSLVRILDKTCQADWTGFRLKVKRVLHSPWPVPKGMIFETGYNSEHLAQPNSWRLEPALLPVR